jgi:hypothetical protein
VLAGAVDMFCVIVDGYSTGAGLAREFGKSGFSCIHVQSQFCVPKVYSHTYNPSDYFAHYVYGGSAEALAEKLRKYMPSFVIPGAECGIGLADQLSEILNVVGNGVVLSSCRRNKYLMLETVKSKNLTVIPSCCVSTEEEAIAWAVKQAPLPLIVKPLNSAGGEGVRMCQTVDDISQAYLDIMSTKINMLGFENQSILLQHYIEGEEYVVNTVSYAGEHKLCELWKYTRYQRPGGRQIYDTASVVDYHMEEHEEVVNYAMKIIAALGIKYGPAHVEIIKNERGCFLIEMGARLMGANLPFSLLSKCVSTSQALTTVEAYVAPDVFKQKLLLSYEVLQPLTAIFMVSNCSGQIESIEYQDKIHACESFFDMNLAVHVGDKLSKTIDYQTSPGMIYLSHKDPRIVEADKRYIRELEKTMFTLTSENLAQDMVEL